MADLFEAFGYFFDLMRQPIDLGGVFFPVASDVSSRIGADL